MLYELWRKLDKGKAYCRARGELKQLKTMEANGKAAGFEEFIVEAGKALPGKLAKAHPDGRLAELPADDAAAAGFAPARCKGTTKAGKPCKKAPAIGSEFCKAHQDQAE